MMVMMMIFRISAGPRHLARHTRLFLCLRLLPLMHTPTGNSLLTSIETIVYSSSDYVKSINKATKATPNLLCWCQHIIWNVHYIAKEFD